MKLTAIKNQFNYSFAKADNTDNLVTGIKEIIRWYLNNNDWWTRIQADGYQQYQIKQYREQLRDSL